MSALDPRLLWASRVAVQLRGGGRHGLANLGNTCYLNAALQCLGHCLPLAAFVLGRGWELHAAAAEPRLLRALHAVWTRLWIERVPCRPARLLDELRALLPGLDLHAQNDPHELLLRAVERLEAESPALRPFFEGATERAAACLACGADEPARDAWRSLQLPVPDRAHDGVALSALLARLQAPERVPGWRCHRCGARDGCERRLLAHARPPHVLMTCLLRYEAAGAKVDTAVRPDAALDFAGRRYALAATLSHHGHGLQGGHYTADCADAEGGWWRLDDGAAHPAPDPAAAPCRAVYMAFYVAVAPP